MKGLKYILFLISACWLSACVDLDVPPENIAQEPDIFTTSNGINTYMSRMYSELPIEDFRYTPARLFNHFWIISPTSGVTGEAISRDQSSSRSEDVGYWGNAYSLIREANMFLETLPKYAGNFSEVQVKQWLAEAYFVRGVTYFALTKRYGGVPIVNAVLQYPEQSIDEMQIPRSSEVACYDQIANDLDSAIMNMVDKSDAGRANKYVAIAYKCRAMLHAGSIAKYNQTTLFDNDHNQLCGIPREKAVAYFKSSYEAAKMLEGKYSLYKKIWSAGDKNAQFQNYVDLFFDNSSPENIFVKKYLYPSSVHGYDAYYVPLQQMGGNGYSAEVNPTLEFVELFEGFPKNADGTARTLDSNGKYELYTNPMDFFANAEPRLRATVILPGDIFKDEVIEIRRGIYTGSAAGGIAPLLPAGSTDQYPKTNIVESANEKQNPYTLPDGTTMNPAGKSGVFMDAAACALSGFSIRKYLNPNMPKDLVLENRSDQTWIEIRYAEILLSRAEAACELVDLGENGQDYLSDAFTCINAIRERAGATLLTSNSELKDIKVVRNERRKELGFENKIWWDLKRWRIIDKEQNARIWRTLMPFYSADAGKYFFDARYNERNWKWTFDNRWYYQEIPNGEITKSPNLKQNPGY